MESYINNEPTLRDFLRIIFRHKIIFFILPIAIVVPTYIGLQLNTPQFEASVKMLVSGIKEANSDYYKEVIIREALLDYQELVISKSVLEKVVKALELNKRPPDYEKRYASPFKAALIDYQLKKRDQLEWGLGAEAMPVNEAISELKDNISVVESDNSTRMFYITVKDYDPRMAVILANSVSRSYVIFDLEQQIAELKFKYGEKYSIIVQLESYMEELKKTLHGKYVPDIQAITPASIKIIGQARGATMISEANKPLLLILAFVASIIIGVLFALVFDYLDQTIKSPKDLEESLKIRFLGAILKRKLKDKLLIEYSRQQNTDYSRSFQNLSESIYLLIKNKRLNSFLIVDAEGSAETSAVIANIGTYMTHKADLRVLIIDANLRNTSGKISNIFNVSDTVGLTDLIKGDVSFEDVLQKLDSHLDVLPVGKADLNPITVLESPLLPEIVKKTKETYEVVIISCADIKNYTDAVILSSLTDSFILVLNEGKVRKQVIKNAISPLIEKNVNITGAILNNRKYVIPKIIYKMT